MNKKIILLSASILTLNSAYADFLSTDCSTSIGGKCKSAEGALKHCLKNQYKEEYTALQTLIQDGKDVLVGVTNKHMAFAFDSFPIKDSNCLKQLNGLTASDFSVSDEGELDLAKKQSHKSERTPKSIPSSATVKATKKAPSSARPKTPVNYDSDSDF